MNLMEQFFEAANCDKVLPDKLQIDYTNIILQLKPDHFMMYIS